MNVCKRLLPFLLALVMMVGCLPFAVSAEEVTIKFHGIDCARGSGQLIIYTEGYGATTNTNEWGVEAVVGPDNCVISVGGNNNTIPAGGFVVSGHESETDGRMRTWINQNIHVGDYVYYNERTNLLIVSDTPIDMNAAVFYEVERKYDGTNSTRYTNQLIIYNPNKGAKTGTNEYGFEVTVQDGLVVAMGGNDSPIPKDGYVVSAHGTAIDWLRTNVQIGMSAQLNTVTKTIKFIYDADSLQRGMAMVLDTLEPKLQEAKENFLYVQYDVLEEQIKDTKKLFADAIAAHKNGGTDAELASTCGVVNKQIDLIRNSISESYTVQYRAAWVRPSQNSAAEVDAYVKKLHDAGINTICVEGNFSNGVIMNTPKDCYFQRIKTFNYDVLQAYVDACHKYDMECHLWMAIMEVGHSKGSNYNDCIAYKKPEWLSLNQNGNPNNPDDFMMIDPANDEAREYLVKFYEWIIRNYDIDCFELDYIRYYTRAGDLDFGYTQAAFEKFEEKYHHGVTPTYNPDASWWNDWKQFRMDQITEMVKAVREMIDRVDPSVLLSADVVANPNGGTEYNYQDYLTWMENDWIDILHPMAYGDGFDEDIKLQVQIGGDRCMIVTGLGVFMAELGATEMVNQSIEDNLYGAYGDCFFEGSAYLKDKAGEALLETVYRNDAMTPFLDREAALKETLNYMQGRIDDILLPLKGITNAEAEALTSAIAAAKESVADYRIASVELANLRSAIAAVKNDKARLALEGDLLRTEKIMCVTFDVDRDGLVDDLEIPEGDGSEPDPEDPWYNESEDESSEDTSVDTSVDTSLDTSKEPSEDTSAEESKSATSAPASEGESEGGNGTTTVIVVICVVVILGAGVFLVLFLRKK